MVAGLPSMKRQPRTMRFYASHCHCAFLIFHTLFGMAQKSTPINTTRYKFSILLGQDVELEQWQDYKSDLGKVRICVQKHNDHVNFWVTIRAL